MAKRVGVGAADLVGARTQASPGELVKTLKLSNDRHFEEKLINVVGLYLHPPDQAVILRMDEKSQTQAVTGPSPHCHFVLCRGTKTSNS